MLFCACRSAHRSAQRAVQCSAQRVEHHSAHHSTYRSARHTAQRPAHRTAQRSAHRSARRSAQHAVHRSAHRLARRSAQHAVHLLARRLVHAARCTPPGTSHACLGSHGHVPIRANMYRHVSADTGVRRHASPRTSMRWCGAILWVAARCCAVPRGSGWHGATRAVHGGTARSRGVAPHSPASRARASKRHTLLCRNFEERAGRRGRRAWLRVVDWKGPIKTQSEQSEQSYGV